MLKKQIVVLVCCGSKTFKSHQWSFPFEFVWCESEADVFDNVVRKYPNKYFYICIADHTFHLDLNRLVQEKNVKGIYICYQWKSDQRHTDTRIEYTTMDVYSSRLKHAQYEAARHDTRVYQERQDPRQILHEEETQFLRQKLMTINACHILLVEANTNVSNINHTKQFLFDACDRLDREHEGKHVIPTLDELFPWSQKTASSSADNQALEQDMMRNILQHRKNITKIVLVLVGNEEVVNSARFTTFMKGISFGDFACFAFVEYEAIDPKIPQRLSEILGLNGQQTVKFESKPLAQIVNEEGFQASLMCSHATLEERDRALSIIGTDIYRKNNGDLSRGSDQFREVNQPDEGNGDSSDEDVLVKAARKLN